MKKIRNKTFCKYFILVGFILMLVSCGEAYMYYEANEPLRFPISSKSYNNAEIIRRIKPFEDEDGKKESIGLRFGGKEVIFHGYLRSGNKYVLSEWDEAPLKFPVYSNGKIYDYIDLGEIKYINVIDDKTIQLVYNEGYGDKDMTLRFYKKGKKRVRSTFNL